MKNNRLKASSVDIDPKLMRFYCVVVCITAVIMCLAYKTTNWVWHGIHDTLIFKNSVVVIIMALSALASAVFLLVGKRLVFLRDPLSLCLYALVAFAALSFVWAERPGFATHKTLMWAAGLMTFFCCAQFFKRQDLLITVLNAVFFAGALVAFIGLLQAIFGATFVPQATPPASTFSNKNMANHPIILSFGLGIYFLYGYRSQHFAKNLYYALALGIMLAFVVHTHTRAAWLGLFLELLLIGVFVLIFVLRKQPVVFFDRSKVLATLIGLLCMLLLMSLSYDRAKKEVRWINPLTPVLQLVGTSVNSVVDEQESKRSSFAIRKKIWAATVDVIEENPLMGQGMGNFYISYMRHYRNNTESIRRAHNDYLEMIAEIGYIGFGIFALGMLFCLYYLTRLLKSDHLKDQRLLLACVTGMLLGTAENAFFSFPYFHITPMILMGIYLALVVVFYHQMKAHDASSKGLNTQHLLDLKEQKVLAALVLAVLVFFCSDWAASKSTTLKN